MLRMPLIFFGHGSPMNAIEENPFVHGFRKIAKQISRPRAILSISAHWETDGTFITAMERPKTIHDFYGFPKKLFEIQYPAEGSPDLAREIQSLFKPIAIDLDYSWGLDHGTWSILIHLYPKADIPVLQLSLNQNITAAEHYELAKKLKPLRDSGVLIIGSGNILHNLAVLNFQTLQNAYAYDWAELAESKIKEWIRSKEHLALINYKKQEKALQLAIPSPEHFYPLLYILALQEESDSIRFFNDQIVGGSLSMTSLFLHA